jgi:hypothetical protein
MQTQVVSSNPWRFQFTYESDMSFACNTSHARILSVSGHRLGEFVDDLLVQFILGGELPEDSCPS